MIMLKTLMGITHMLATDFPELTPFASSWNASISNELAVQQASYDEVGNQTVMCLGTLRFTYLWVILVVYLADGMQGEEEQNKMCHLKFDMGQAYYRSETTKLFHVSISHVRRNSPIQAVRWSRILPGIVLLLGILYGWSSFSFDRSARG